MATNNYNEEISEILLKFKLKLVVCEYGTNGLISSLLANTSNSKKTFVGSYIINNEGMIQSLNLNSTDSNFIQTLSFTALRKTKADVCLTSYLVKDTLEILIVLLKKEYRAVYNIGNNMNKATEATILSLTFLSNKLQEANK
ncbi:MAG: hypothetical protein LBV53_01650 [Mycoplasmataceae bacterium]|jgi:hypothetical protein|nr:hypothetical protein [Mycoplasmataceae bacterium]